MSPNNRVRVAYVVKRYPRFSETFIANEILAHEVAGLEIVILALRPSEDTHFQEAIARVRAPVHYLSLPGEGLADPGLTTALLRASAFWAVVRESSPMLPGLWPALEAAQDEETREIYQAILLAREVRRRGITHLHAHFATSATTVARLAARFAGVPYTFTAHAKDIFHESVQPDDLRRKLNDASAVVTVSDYNVQYLREHYDAAAERVRRIYNGMDLARFPYKSPQDRPQRIVAVGRLVEKKGFDDLVDACAVLAERGRHFSCQIIGGGGQDAELRARVQRLGLERYVELAGPRPQSEVIQIVQSAAVLAAPCIVSADGDRDGLPTVFPEAMALGTPCVSTDVTGIPEIVRDAETGLLAPQRDPVRLAGAIERLLVDSNLRVQLATRARRLIETEFDVHHNTAQLRAIFQAAARGGLSALPETR